MLNNGTVKSKNLINVVQKAIMAGIGVAVSKETITKAACGIYEDVQSIVQKLLDELEGQGKLKTKETKKLLQEIQKKIIIEKNKAYKKLQVDSKDLIKQIKENVLIKFYKSNSSDEILISNKAKKPKKKKTIKKTRKTKSKSNKRVL